jgi:ankyrin repeat protein
MDIDDERDVYEQFLERLTLPREKFLARRFTLVRGEACEASPHQAPKLELLVNADRKLFEAVMANDLRRVSTWLERGANPNARAPEGWTSLFEAVMPPSKEPAITELLLAKGADVRVRDKNGQTPLHAAAIFGEEAHLCVLLNRGGAEIDARDTVGRTPLHLAQTQQFCH